MKPALLATSSGFALMRSRPPLHIFRQSGGQVIDVILDNMLRVQMDAIRSGRIAFL